VPPGKGPSVGNAQYAILRNNTGISPIILLETYPVWLIRVNHDCSPKAVGHHKMDEVRARFASSNDGKSEGSQQPYQFSDHKLRPGKWNVVLLFEPIEDAYINE